MSTQENYVVLALEEDQCGRYGEHSTSDDHEYTDQES